MENYKEKYEQALDNLMKIKNANKDNKELVDFIEHKYPELKDSEDEKIRKEIIYYLDREITLSNFGGDISTFKKWIAWLEKQGQKQHLELKAGHWYFCHQAYCERADILTVKEGERFQCEKDGVVKGLVIKEPAKYFTECDAPAHMEIEQKLTWSEEDENI